jgi:hypothetical protein
MYLQLLRAKMPVKDSKYYCYINNKYNMSVSNVKVKLHRIRKKLAVEINKLMYDE